MRYTDTEIDNIATDIAVTRGTQERRDVIKKLIAELQEELAKVISSNLPVMQSLPLLKTENFGEEGWIAQLEGVAGMVTQGQTEEEAINELMISIKAMLLHKRGNVA